MLSAKMEKMLNQQINAETYSAYLYFSMSAYFSSINLEGFASWMRIQGLEELTHAEKFFRYLSERGARVRLAAIEAPPVEWDSPLAAMEQQYEHEQKVTAMINALVDLALDERDHATNSFLKWFVDEQVEEEATADGLVQKLKLVGAGGNVLFMMDRELGQRIFTPPAAE